MTRFTKALAAIKPHFIYFIHTPGLWVPALVFSTLWVLCYQPRVDWHPEWHRPVITWGWFYPSPTTALAIKEAMSNSKPPKVIKPKAAPAKPAKQPNVAHDKNVPIKPLPAHAHTQAKRKKLP